MYVESVARRRMYEIRSYCMIVILCIVVCNTTVYAAHWHFSHGGTGIKVATLPPPGCYYEGYFSNTRSNHMRIQDRAKTITSTWTFWACHTVFSRFGTSSSLSVNRP